VSDFAAHHEALIELQEELQKLKTGVSTIESFSGASQQILKNINGVKAENQATAKELQANLKVFEQSVSAIQTRIAELINAIEANIANLQQILSSLDEVNLPATFESIEQKLGALSADFEQIKRETENGQTQIKQLLGNHTSRILALDTEVQQLRQAVAQSSATTEATIHNINNRINALKTTTSDNHQMLSKLHTDVRNLQGRQDELKVMLERQNQTLKSAEDRLRVVQREQARRLNLVLAAIGVVVLAIIAAEAIGLLLQLSAK